MRVVICFGQMVVSVVNRHRSHLEIRVLAWSDSRVRATGGHVLVREASCEMSVRHWSRMEPSQGRQELRQRHQLDGKVWLA